MKKRLIIAIVLAIIMVTALTLAACKETKYKLVFVLGDEAVAAGIDMEPVMTNGFATRKDAPVPPEWTGHKFVSWHESEDLSDTSRVGYPCILTENTVWYAKWVVDGDNPNPDGEKHTVKFQTNGGTPIADMLTASIAESPKTTKAGNTFIGWYTDSKCETGKIAFPYTVTEDITKPTARLPLVSKPTAASRKSKTK